MDNEFIDDSRMWFRQTGDWNLEPGDLLQGFVSGFRQEMGPLAGRIEIFQIRLPLTAVERLC